MKKKNNMKTNIASIFAAATLALFTAACANEETTKPETNPEAPAAGMTFVGGSAIKTRTSLDVTLPGGTTVDYFWEPSDKIWTADGATGTAQITAKSATANFRMSKAYTTSTVDVYYPGVNATAYNQVTIATAQTQTEPNSTQHLGAAGDCGTATAHKQSDNSYKFDLDHKASYLCLLPRTPNGLVSTYITQVKIISDNNIAGTYTLTKTGLTGSGSSNTITLTTPGDGSPAIGPYNYWTGATTVPAPGFPLNNAATSQATNAMYVVIAPGTHALTIEYTLYDTGTQKGGVVKKTIASAAYAPNTLYPLTANINPVNYPNNIYYMWDAAEDQNYWKGYENVMPDMNDKKNQNDYPKTNADPRWYNETATFPAQATRSAKNYPNVNEWAWYISQDGDPHYDNTTLWCLMGHLYTKGMWIRKQSVIAAKTGKTIAQLKAAAPDGIDYTTQTSGFMSPYRTLPIGLPAPIGDYFFLPALGNTGANLVDVGNYGHYRSSSTGPGNPMNLYTVGFHTNEISIAITAGNQRDNGIPMFNTTDEDKYRPNGL